MSETKVLFESHSRSGSNSSINSGGSSNNNNNNNVQENGDANRNRRSPVGFLDNQDSLKARSSLLDNLDRRSPRDLLENRRNSTYGLDLSKTLLNSPTDGINGLDLSKSEHNSTNTYSRPSDLIPIPLGIPADNPPAPASVSFGPGRGENASGAVSPFRADSVPSGYSPDNLTTGGGYKSKFQESYNKSLDSAPPRFQKGFANEAFEPITTSPELNKSGTGSPIFTTKISDSYTATKISESSPFPKPQDTYSKILEDFGNNARNNNNNVSGSKLNKDFPSIPSKLPDTPYRKMSEPYTKEIDSPPNGFKSESSIFKQENSLSPGAFKTEPPAIGTVIKPDPTIPNGGNYGSKTDNASSSPSQSSNQSLPSIFNFSANHFRGISAAESGLASYLNNYGLGGVGGERSENKGGSGRDGQSGGNGGGGGGGGNGGSGGGDSNMSRSSPNNKLACRFCGKTFSQAGYIKAHERLHTGEKPFACSVCGKRFSDPSNWKKHERVHANNKKQGHLMDSHESKVCGRTFAQSGSYRMHERRHMTDSVQRCHICYATFNSWQDLQRHMASHPQVTQAIMEFEDGNQGLIDRLNSGDLGGQLGDGGIGPLGHSDGDGQVHGPNILQGDCGNQRDLSVHHGRCPNPLLPESLLLDSDAAAFHVQSPGLFHPSGQLPPFSSILPFRHHPGGPPTFSPSFAPGLGLLGHQSLPVTSHAELLSKHPFFGAMISSQIKHDALSKLSPTYSSQQPQLQPHHLIHQQQHQSQLIEQQQQLLEHGAIDSVDVVTTTSASKRAELEQRGSNRSYTPDERSDSAAVANGRGESSAFNRSVSSDEGSHSPEDNHMEVNGDEENIQQDHEMADNDNDDDTDIDDRNYQSERDYSDTRRFSQNGERSMGEKERDRDFGPRHSGRSYEGDPDKEKRGYKKERNPSGGSGNSDKNSNGNHDGDADFAVQDRDRNYDNDRTFDPPHNGRTSSSNSNRTSINRHDKSSSGQSSSKEKRLTKSLSSIFAITKHISSGENSSSINNADDNNAELRPPKRHIERQNLNTRMIPSSSSRKQRHPMRRFSSAGSEQESPQSSSSLPVSSTTAEAIERGDIDDNDLVTFLLTKGRVHKCVHCHMIFEDASLFLLHNGFHSHDDPFRCVVCSAVCKDRVDFNCHLTSHIK